MTIIQELPSTTGVLRVNRIENAAYVFAEKCLLPKTLAPQDVITCELPLGKRYSIGHFPTVEHRDRCLRYIEEHKAADVLQLPLEKFFMHHVLEASLVKFVLEEYTIQKYLLNLFEKNFRKFTPSEVRDLDAFSQFTIPDVLSMRKGKYVDLSYEGLPLLWAKTLPISKLLMKYGLTPVQYFETLIKNNANIDISTRIFYPGM